MNKSNFGWSGGELIGESSESGRCERHGGVDVEERRWHALRHGCER